MGLGPALTGCPSVYAGPMRRAVRIGLVALGAAMAVYGAASLTGGWLGLAPWESRNWGQASRRQELRLPPGTRVEYVDEWSPAERAEWESRNLGGGYFWNGFTPRYPKGARWHVSIDQDRSRTQNRPFAITVAAVGLALVAVGAWPRRRAGVTS